MYLLTEDFMTIWKLAHHWAGYDNEEFSVENLPDDLKKVIYRILHAVVRDELHVRNHRGLMFSDKSFFGSLTDFNHYRKIAACIRKGKFDEAYLKTLYIKRPDLLRWCETDFLTPPKRWQHEDEFRATGDYDASDDENIGWYDDLTERRKRRVACLEMAKQLWNKNPNQSYEEIYRHPNMIEYGYPNEFSLEAFKKWARNFAPEFATRGGRPIKNN